MREGTWARVEAWWASLFGCEKALLWQGVSIRPHAGLGGHEGIFVAGRAPGYHVSLPTWVDKILRESLSEQGVSRLATPTGTP